VFCSSRKLSWYSTPPAGCTWCLTPLAVCIWCPTPPAGYRPGVKFLQLATPGILRLQQAEPGILLLWRKYLMFYSSAGCT
jgi:hypothetical protein